MSSKIEIANESVQQTLHRLEEEDDIVQDQETARNDEWFQNFERLAKMGLASIAPKEVVNVVPKQVKQTLSKPVAHLLSRTTKLGNITCTVIASTKKSQPELRQETIKAKRRVCTKRRVEKLPTAPSSPIAVLDNSVEEYQLNDDVQQEYAVIEVQHETRVDESIEECQRDSSMAEYEYHQQVLDRLQQSVPFVTVECYHEESAQYITDLDHQFEHDYSSYSRNCNEYSIEDMPLHYMPVLGDAF